MGAAIAKSMQVPTNINCSTITLPSGQSMATFELIGGGKTALPVPVAIIDTSYSMGNSGIRSLQLALAAAYKSVGYSGSTIIYVIKFSTNATLVKMTLDKLSTAPLIPDGCTYMHEVPPILAEVLSSIDSNVHLTIVSDGSVGDRQIIVSMMKDFVSPSSFDCNVHIICVGESAEATALTCFSILSTTPESCIQVGRSDVGTMTSSLVSSLEAHCSNSVTIKIPCGAARYFGGPESDTFSVNSNPTTLIVNTPDIRSIDCPDDTTITFENINPADVLTHFMSYWTYLESMMKKCIVTSRDTSALTKFLQDLNDYLESFKDVCEDADDAHNDYAVSYKISRMKKKMARTTDTILLRIAELANADTVAAMRGSHARQADIHSWLGKSVMQDRTATATCKRLAKAQAGGASASDTMAALLDSLLDSVSEMIIDDDTFDDEVPSVLSQNTNSVNIAELAHMTPDMFTMLTIPNMVQMFGPVGMPILIKTFNGAKNSCVDPWTCIYIDTEVTAYNLSTADACDALGRRNTIGDTSGTTIMDQSYNGVLPMRSCGSVGYDLMFKHIYPVIKAGISFTIRDMIEGSLAHEIPALNVAVLVHLLKNCGASGSPLEILQKYMHGIIDNLNHYFTTRPSGCPFTPIAQNLLKPDVGVHLTGVNEVSVNKVIAILFAHPEVKSLYPPTDDATTAQLQNIMFELMRYAQYMYLRKRFNPTSDMSRIDELHALIGLDTTDRVLVQDPHVDEPTIWTIKDTFPMATDVPSDVSEFFDDVTFNMLCALWRLIHTGTDEPLSSPVDPANVFGFETTMNEFKNNLVATMIMVATEPDRVEDGKMKIPDLRKVSGISFINQIFEDYWMAVYEKQLKEKKAEEFRLDTITAITKYLKSPSDDFSEYVTILGEYVPSHVSNGGVVLNEMFHTIPPENIPNLIHKVWFYLIGSDFDGNKIWNSGNIYRGDLKHYAAIVTSIDHDKWCEMMKIYKTRSVYTYRANLTNRHGHGNYNDGNKPSHFAFGFKTMSEMQKKTDPGWYAMYCRTHRYVGGGCGLTSEHVYAAVGLAPTDDFMEKYNLGMVVYKEVESGGGAEVASDAS